MAPSVSNSTSNSISIVLADDDPDFRALASARLRASGMTVWEASNGEEALDEWELTLYLNDEANLTSEWGAWYEPEGTTLRVVPTASPRLEAGQALQFGFCSEPGLAILAATSKVEVRPEPEPAE